MPEKMNYDLVKLTDIMEWDVVNWSQALPFWLENTSLDLASTTALEIGSRGGGLSIFLAEHCKEVVCSDLDNPKEKASELHSKYDIKNISYKALSALELKDEKSKLIVTKSVLGSFQNEVQDKVIENIYNALEKGGEYWFVENLSATFIHRFARKTFVKWGGRWNYLEYNNIQKKFSKFANIKFKTAGLLGAFGMTQTQRNLLGYLDKHVLDKITPSNMNYIVIGVAIK